MVLVSHWLSGQLFLALALCQQSNDPPADPYACSTSSPCKIGCCGKNNICGLGPNYCSAANCTSSCNAKSECDPGWGSQWSNAEACPLNVCCSKYGFCGTTSDFCGTATVAAPSCGSGTSASQRIIGYYEGWSSTRACKGLYPENILAGAYTHLYYSFAFVDPSSFSIAPMSDLDVQLYPRFTGLKQLNPGLETWISIGGWSMNDPDQPTATTFSTLAGSTSAQSAFFKSLVNFMSTYGFDGVDIDWEYPVAPERSGNPQDFANYVTFLSNLRNALGSAGHKYGLSITIPSSYWYMQNFDIKKIEPLVDWFQVMTYDLHGTWDSTDPYIGAIVQAHTNLTEIDQTMDLLWRNQIDPAKVTMGIGFYGRSFTLSNPSCSAAGCPFSAGGNPGPCSASAGTLMYSEIEDIVAAGATQTVDMVAGVAIVTWDTNQWVSYDNNVTLKLKMNYANSHCLGGVMIWAASTDDAAGSAILALNTAAGRDPTKAYLQETSASSPMQCVWGQCNTACPSGYVPATSGNGKNAGYAGIFNGCPSGQSRYYCCPTGQAPVCTWRGTAPACNMFGGANCHSNEVEVTSSTSGGGHWCSSGHKNLCCTKTGSDADVQACDWVGAAPICTAKALIFRFASASCPSNNPNQLTTSRYGPGGDKPCLYNGGYKSYCCSNPTPWQNCAWHQADATWISWANAILPVFSQDCKGQCPPGQVPIASDPSNCQAGTYSYFCCDNPNAPSLPTPQEVEICVVPPLPDLSTEPDPEAAPGFIGEFDLYDNQCGAPEGSSSSNLRMRGLSQDWLLDSSVFQNFSMDFIGPRNLEPRGTPDSSSQLKLCFRSATVGFLYPQTYPGHATVAAAGSRGFISVANSALCGTVGVVVRTTADPAVTYVTEHVFEKQLFRDIIEFMMLGVLPSGGTLSAGALAYTQLFSQGGLFYQNWPSGLTVPSPYGTYGGGNIMAAFFGILGRVTDRGMNNANLDNLQVVDADLNDFKGKITRNVAFLASGTFEQLGGPGMTGALQDIVDTFQYMSLSQTQQSFLTTYNALYSLLGVFGSAALNQYGINYNFQQAFKDILTDALNLQVTTTRSLMEDYIDTAETYWNSVPALAWGQQAVDANQAALAKISNGLTSYISYDLSKMMG